VFHCFIVLCVNHCNQSIFVPIYRRHTYLCVCCFGTRTQGHCYRRWLQVSAGYLGYVCMHSPCEDSMIETLGTWWIMGLTIGIVAWTQRFKKSATQVRCEPCEGLAMIKHAYIAEGEHRTGSNVLLKLRRCFLMESRYPQIQWWVVPKELKRNVFLRGDRTTPCGIQALVPLMRRNTKKREVETFILVFTWLELTEWERRVSFRMRIRLIREQREFQEAPTYPKTVFHSGSSFSIGPKYPYHSYRPSLAIPCALLTIVLFVKLNANGCSAPLRCDHQRESSRTRCDWERQVRIGVPPLRRGGARKGKAVKVLLCVQQQRFTSIFDSVYSCHVVVNSWNDVRYGNSISRWAIPSSSFCAYMLTTWIMPQMGSSWFS
jgi:hypothetical protein